MGAKRRAISIITAMLLVFSSLTYFTGFTYLNGLGTVYYDNEETIFDGVKYREIISGDSVNGIEHMYTVTSEGDNGIFPIVFNGEVHGTYTVGSMIKYAEEQGYKVVAAINADIFDTSRGTPKGLAIHDRNIVTSGYAPDRVIAFDEKGKASLEKVELTYLLSGIVEGMDTMPVEVTSEAINADGTTSIAISTDYVEAPYSGDWNSYIDFFNVPHGAANGLHLYNRHYSTSTKTTGSNCEVVIECPDIQLGINKTIKGTVKSVKTDTCNTPITDSTLVLSTVSGSATYDMLSKLKIGSEISISVKNGVPCGDEFTGGSEKLANAKEACGIYYSLVENGSNVTKSGGTHPRTAFGIMKNGDIMLLELDGRQSTVSKGLDLFKLANTMISLGCETAVNLDGGTSSVIYVREPGKDGSAVRKSNPLNGYESRITNAILFVYKDSSSTSAASHIHVYPGLSYVMPGASVQLSSSASTDLYEKANLPGSVSYSVQGRVGSVNSSGLFTADKDAQAGKVEIKATSGGKSGSAFVEVVKDITIKPSVSKINLQPGEKKDINVTAVYGKDGAAIPVKSSDELFTWTCDANIGTVDEHGVFTAEAGSINAESGNIYITYGENTAAVPVSIGSSIVVFADTSAHWAKDHIGTLAMLGMLSGVGNNMFMPDSQLTRAQFVTMLAKITAGVDVNAAQDAGFTDVPASEWYFPYVNWGYESGIVSGMGDGTFAPDAPITREQMAVMLCKYSVWSGFVLPQTVSGISFTDAESISSWAVDYVMTTAGAGIVNGFETGEFMPQGQATRAQAATMIYKFCNIKGVL